MGPSRRRLIESKEGTESVELKWSDGDFTQRLRRPNRRPPYRNCTFLAQTAREEAARDAVEVVEVAEASLDHGEQMLKVTHQKASRLASIEGRKLFRQQPPRLRLFIVRVRDEMDLDTLLVAAHWHTRTNND